MILEKYMSKNMNNFEILRLNKPDVTDFALERNILMGKSKSEWVLFLDTDEEISKELKHELKNLDTTGYSGFWIKRKIVFLGKEIGEDKVVRFGKKDAGKWHRAVHETWELKGKIGTLKNYIVHSTAENLSEYVEKMNKYSTLHAMENKKEGKRSTLLKIIIFPKLKLLQNLFLGRGFTFSMLQSFHSFLGWVKLWELQRK